MNFNFQIDKDIAMLMLQKEILQLQIELEKLYQKDEQSNQYKLTFCSQ